jgi:hypothetical protein
LNVGYGCGRVEFNPVPEVNAVARDLKRCSKNLPKGVEAMRRIILSVLFVVSAIGLVRAQDSNGDMPRRMRELTADGIKKVKAELLDLEEQKVNCFSNVGEEAGWSADWIKWHDADAIIHLSERLRTKTELMDELRTGMRRNLLNEQFNHAFHIYGDGGDGTTVVMSMTGGPNGSGMNLYGIRHASGGGGGGLGIDVWTKVDGRWWFIVHCPGTGEPEPRTGELPATTKAGDGQQPLPGSL